MVTGDTPNVVPAPSKVPPQDPEYQFQVAPVPKVPPVTERVVAWLGQVGLTLADTLAAATELVLTVTVTLTQAVVLQVPSART